MSSRWLAAAAGPTAGPDGPGPVRCGAARPVHLGAVCRRARKGLERSGEMVTISAPRVSDLKTLLPPR